MAAAEDPAVDLLGQLSIELDGAHYLLRPSRAAIASIGRAIGKSRGMVRSLALTELALECGSMVLSVDELGICVAELMRATAAFDPEVSADYRGARAEVLADLIYEAGGVDVMRRLALIFTGALTGGYTASGEAKAAGMKTTEPTPTAD